MDRGFPARCRAATGPADGMSAGGYSIWVIDQQKPASSRAAATAIRVRRLPLASRRAQVRCRRRWALQATATAWAGCPSWRSVSALAVLGV